jgi:LPXTG-motif cell wall-anchored protein
MMPTNQYEWLSLAWVILSLIVGAWGWWYARRHKKAKH